MNFSLRRAVSLSIPLFFASSPLAHAKFAKVSVGGVSISGLDQTGATRRLKRELGPKLDRRVGLAAGRRVVYRKRRELGFSLDLGAMLARAGKGQKRVGLAFNVDQKAAAKSLSRLAKRFSSAPVDARPVLVKGKVRIRPQVVGQKLDVSKSAARLKILAEKNATQTRFALADNQIAPRLSSARLKGINAVLATFRTRFNPGKVKRTRNMGVAIRAIDGTLLSPNEVFSLNKTVGERTQARGYRTAIIFENGKKEPGLGGGVSQVTGTLFNAALVAGLPIVSYRVHSRPVAYLPLGRDATVAWGSFDMKFKNNTNAPIFISYKLSGDTATATLFGKRTGKRGSMKVVSKKIGARAIEAKLFRTTRQNGKVVRKAELVGTSSYSWKVDDAD